MHGITKEIHRAVRASALEERSQPSDEDAKSEHAYRGLLQSLRKERDVHTRIVGDAHTNRDPPAALVEPCKKLGLDLRASSPQHRDCKRIDAILASTEARVKGRFVTGEVPELDTALGQVDDCVAMWKVGRARETAWVNAEALWALRGTPRLSSKFLLTLDRTVGFAGRSPLDPIVIPAPIA